VDVESGGRKPKPEKLGARLQSIWVRVWFIDCPVCVMVLPRLLANSVAVCWLAMTPAGIETRIAMENPKAIITSNARIFLLEIFLIALLMIPKFCTFQSKHFRQPRAT
jgi:hypothetical protein